METTNKFSVARTAILIKKLLIEQSKTNIMRLVVLFGSLIIIAVFIGYAQDYTHVAEINTDHAIQAEQVAFAAMLFILGTVYVSTAFNTLIQKTGRISMLSLPANSSEKFVAHWVVYVVLFLAAFFCAIWVADWARYILMKILHPECPYLTTLKWKDIFNTEGSGTIAVFLNYQSFFLLGSVIWPRYSFIKTYFALTALSLIFALTCGACVALIIPPDYHYNMSFMARFEPVHVLWYFTGLVCVINYSLTYLRLRESEVINRF